MIDEDRSASPPMDADPFRLLVEGVREYAIIMLDPAGRIMTWNAGAERIQGYTAVEAVGRHFSLLYPEEDRARGRPALELERALREGRHAEEGWLLRRGGERFWASVVITPLRDGAGEVAGFAQVTRDLTDRRSAEEALRESESRLAGIVASAMDGIITTDEQRRIIVFNAAAERLFGVPAADAIGTSLDRFIPERYRADHAEHMRRFSATGETTRSMHRAPGALPALRADGTEFPVEATISHAVVAGQRLFTVVLRDVTERVQAEAERSRALFEAEAARAAAEEANRTRGEFVATMSHELRTPLNAMVGYTELLLMGIPRELPPEAREQVERIRLSAQHLRELIDQVLSFSRVEAGREVVRAEPVDVPELVREVSAIAEPLAVRKGLRFEAVVPERAGGLVTDPAKLRQILLNLVGNAVKFTDEGEVVLSVAADPERISFAIRDTGIGVQPEHLPYLFEPFWQADGSFRRSTDGTGLGLAISDRFVRMLGGGIEVESAPRVGSTFIVRLPRRVV